MPLYFAYGSNMSVDGMARRCPRSKPIGPARLERHRIVAMREGWISVVRDPRSVVHGVLWDLALSDIRALDRYEGPAYIKASQPVVAAGGPKRALLYFGKNSGPGVLRAGYLAEVLAAARAWSLPEEAISGLQKLGPGGAERGGVVASAR